MRLSVCAALVALTATVSGAENRSDRRVVYFSSDRARSVTLSQAGATLASFTVPIGTVMAVTYQSSAEPNLTTPRFEAHGSVSIRVVRESAIRGSQADAFLVAPVMLAGTMSKSPFSNYASNPAPAGICA